MDCEEAQVVSIAHILDDLGPESSQCSALKDHLLSCRACAEDYKDSKWVVAFIEGHKALFRKVFRTIDEKRDGQQKASRRGVPNRVDGLKVHLNEDTRLMLKAANGDAPAFERLYRKYFEILWAQKGMISHQGEDQRVLLSLLQEQPASHNVLQGALRLVGATEKPCSTAYIDLVNQINKNIETVGVFERQLVRRGHRK